jgi:hypothetical protein
VFISHPIYHPTPTLPASPSPWTLAFCFVLFSPRIATLENNGLNSNSRIVNVVFHKQDPKSLSLHYWMRSVFLMLNLWKSISLHTEPKIMGLPSLCGRTLSYDLSCPHNHWAIILLASYKRHGENKEIVTSNWIFFFFPMSLKLVRALQKCVVVLV